MTAYPINNTISTANNVGITTTSTPQDVNPFGLVTASLALQELLKHLREEMQQQQAQSEEPSSSSDEESTATSVSSSLSVSDSSTPAAPGTMTLAQIIANITLMVANIQGQLAKVQQQIAEGNISIQNSQSEQAQEGFDSWKKNMEAQASAEANKSKWQKFCDSFSDVMKTVCEYADKYVPALALANKIEDKAFGGHIGLAAIDSGVTTAMDKVNEGLFIAIDKTADFLSGGDPKLKIVMEVLLCVAIAVGAYASAGLASALLSTFANFAAGTAATEAVAGAANDIEMVDLAVNGARAGTQMAGEVAGEVANVANVTEEAATQSTSLLGRVWNTLSNMSRQQSFTLFASMHSLQNSNFASDVADRIDSDKGKMAWNTIFNVSAGLIAGAAGYQFIGASLPGGLFTNAFQFGQELQLYTSMVQSYGELHVGLIDLNLADLQNSLGEIEASIKANDGYMGITASQIQSSQSAFRSSMDAESTTIQMLAKAIPVEAQATASAINALKE